MKRARTTASKENRKQFILDCAEELILKEGLSNLSLTGVSKRTKLAVGTIYLYFRSKEEIIASLTIKSREILLRKFIEFTIDQEGALEKIEALLEAFYSFYVENPFYNQLVSFYETNSGLQESEELIEASNKITELVISIIKQGKTEKSVKIEIDEVDFSFWLWGSTIGIIQLIEVKESMLSQTTGRSKQDFYNQHIKLIINSIKQ